MFSAVMFPRRLCGSITARVVSAHLYPPSVVVIGGMEVKFRLAGKYAVSLHGTISHWRICGGLNRRFGSLPGVLLPVS
jgi:hypothetical protein